MRKVLLLLAILILFFNFSNASGADDKVCALYFTYLFCGNCRYTDPVVLDDWTKSQDNLVIIEYMYDDWGDDNAYIFGLYSQNYGLTPAVPQLVFNSTELRLGRLEVPAAENFISSLQGNPCLLLNGLSDFSDLELNSLPGSPKLWAGSRLLMKVGEGNVSSDFLRELLFTTNLTKNLEESIYNIELITPEPALIAYGQINFTNALMIEDSWILNFNEDINGVITGLNNETEGGYIELPFFGRIDTRSISLPILTLIIAGADAFNPCAFFILTFLLSAMIYARSRKRILIVGGIFLFFSGLIYFLFMCAWLNIFLFAKEIMLLTIIAGCIAVFAGVINIKDYFFFQKGVSLTLPKNERIKFTDRVKNLTKTNSFWGLVAGTIILAVTVNMYELLCTVGFPMVFIRILTFNQLQPALYYLYLIFYTLVYLTPLILIVLLFAATLGGKEFSKENVKRLKLISGTMILLLGLILLFMPSLLENILAGIMVIILALLISGLIMLFKKIRLCYSNKCRLKLNNKTKKKSKK